MNTKKHLPYDFVNFDTFIKEFKKYENDEELEIGWGGSSIFLRKFVDNKYQEIVYLHASIVKFNGRCMIFYPIDWFRYCAWMKKHNKPKSNRVKGLWSVE